MSRERERERTQSFPLLGNDEDASKLFSEGYRYAAITLGSIGNPAVRIKLYNQYKEIGFGFPAVIDPSAIVSKSTEIGEGVFIGKGAIVNTGVKIGVCSIINTGVIIEHDCVIGDFVHIAPGVSLSGGVCIGRHSHIGTGSCAVQYVNIGEDTIIGAGSVVTKDMRGRVVAVGVPCKVVRSI